MAESTIGSDHPATKQSNPDLELAASNPARLPRP